MADFAVGMIAAPSHFLCNMINECISDKKASLFVIYVWVFIPYASGTNLSSLGTLYRRRETVKILNFYEEPPSHSDGSYILGNSFSFRYCSISDDIKFIPSSQRIFPMYVIYENPYIFYNQI